MIKVSLIEIECNNCRATFSSERVEQSAESVRREAEKSGWVIPIEMHDLIKEDNKHRNQENPGQRKTSWTKPPISVYDFLARFLDRNYDNRLLKMPDELREWLCNELDLDTSPSEHCYLARVRIEHEEKGEHYLVQAT